MNSEKISGKDSKLLQIGIINKMSMIVPECFPVLRSFFIFEKFLHKTQLL